MDDIAIFQSSRTLDHRIRIDIKYRDSLLIRVEGGAEEGNGEEKQVRKHWNQTGKKAISRTLKQKKKVISLRNPNL